ncbi:MAG: glycerophosphodiester phosphodiesterase [Cyanobacteria bacterium SBLK]|nr:glycerophosphodiester phosphodiesterase [Cyanobacteria bacterium SBLK]
MKISTIATVLWLPLAIFAFSIGLPGSAVSTGYKTLSGEKPLVIAHRGASGYRPEHTLTAYELAIAQGADYVEPDLVLTKDCVLVARHDRYLSDSTNIASLAKFADRQRKDRTSFDTEDRLDWWVEDFTLAEIKELRAIQTRDRDSSYDGRYEIPTFQEVIDLVRAKEAELGRTIGLYPETKDPQILEAKGFDYIPPLKAVLNQNNLNREDAAIYVQSFHDKILRILDGDPGFNAKLVQLVWQGRQRGWEDTSARPNYPLAQIARYADGVGAYKRLILPEGRQPSTFIQEAHSLGLEVHAWTFRDDSLPDWVTFKDGEEEIQYYLNQGLDGFFTDFPDTGMRSVQNLSPVSSSQ